MSRGMAAQLDLHQTVRITGDGLPAFEKCVQGGEKLVVLLGVSLDHSPYIDPRRLHLTLEELKKRGVKKVIVFIADSLYAQSELMYKPLSSLERCLQIVMGKGLAIADELRPVVDFFNQMDGFAVTIKHFEEVQIECGLIESTSLMAAVTSSSEDLNDISFAGDQVNIPADICLDSRRSLSLSMEHFNQTVVSKKLAEASKKLKSELWLKGVSETEIEEAVETYRQSVLAQVPKVGREFLTVEGDLLLALAKKSKEAGERLIIAYHKPPPKIAMTWSRINVINCDVDLIYILVNPVGHPVGVNAQTGAGLSPVEVLLRQSTRRNKPKLQDLAKLLQNIETQINAQHAQSSTQIEKLAKLLGDVLESPGGSLSHSLAASVKASPVKPLRQVISHATAQLFRDRVESALDACPSPVLEGSPAPEGSASSKTEQGVRTVVDGGTTPPEQTVPTSLS